MRGIVVTTTSDPSAVAPPWSYELHPVSLVAWPVILVCLAVLWRKTTVTLTLLHRELTKAEAERIARQQRARDASDHAALRESLVGGGGGISHTNQLQLTSSSDHNNNALHLH
jgi:hypothetical protein